MNKTDGHAKITEGERLMLVVLDGAINPRMGGGQRSVILFSAMQALGPVDVVVLGTGKDTKIAEFFPGAASLTWVESNRFAKTQRKGLQWLTYNLNRFLFPQRHYAPEPQVVEALKQIVTSAHKVIVCRYALPFCTTGLTRLPNRAIFVDIDDRDDQAITSAAKAMFKYKWLGQLLTRHIVPAVQMQLRTRLRHASFLWYATAEDDLHIPELQTGILRNVPFIANPPDNIAPPSSKADVLFVGTYGHRPNQDGIRWFLRHCWAEIHALHPQARLRIVGLGQWKNIAPEFASLEGVDYVGTVDDITQSYLDARVVISPLFDGGGSKIKVIEACAFSRPIVVSPHSARGFGDALAEVLPQAENAEGFIDLCHQFLSNPQKADDVGHDLYALQQKYFSRAATESQISADIRSTLDRLQPVDG